MSLLTPDLGLLFWMIVSFGMVLVILSKYGFPVIIKAIEQRKAYIDNSLEQARLVKEQLADVQMEADKILMDAKEKQHAILQEAITEKEKIIYEARTKAEAEARQQITEATQRIQEEKERAIRDIRSEITGLSITIAEKVIKEKIDSSGKQQQIINRLLDEVSFSKS
ncbi:F0F1 ATP synthase subunit B [Parabacteroides chinchillae]|uniref:ATP synthase subunit b n=1 Tax=Parabacteroides chinchillae TaxID=871327 RepID=A0A8G2BWV3_9BACT|nr:F0F1 ATP synthase subunit B [Parabacteroides chinchillae]SEF94802.1 ATP synthase F0 subcomplex B subunit [Parabacteroides chinchillae]